VKNIKRPTEETAYATIYWETEYSLGKPNVANGVRALLGTRKHQ